ncbi:WecB/TagA/CpsF family glycosyltransferase [Pseudoalteromonas sp. SA25]|uniref:WecB/TagA/CpsF family glycosyltransferase n=1 Tax=Pseudoalteromonas sp. SA25 TaxID=2686347 RepID=UPI0013FDEF90|nr:WecB/TagA/CpsF family glycosyltransferase [Pseudoalteromonas sp. SA25]
MINKVNIGGIEVIAYPSIDELISSSILTTNNVLPGVGVAINPEKIMAANNDPKVMSILQKATLRYPDGIGVSYVMQKRLGTKVARIPGCELWEQLMLRSVEQQIPVFLLGATKNTVTQTSNKLKALDVNVIGCRDGYFTDEQQATVINEIVNSGAKIVSVALGSPRQELFIFECIKRAPHTFFMGVGGTYDVYTNNVKRAPYFFRVLNLEWLFRLLSQPSRLFRQGNLLKYIYYYLTNKI